LARRAGTGLIAAGLVGAAALVTMTPSAGSADRRTRHWISAHHGLDMSALAGAVGGVLVGRDAGGSTIEVQLAKLLYTDDPLRHPDHALARRREVVDRLRAIGVLTAAQAFATNRTTLQLATAQLSLRPGR
jgi:membrane peptidoglycan carboxypeptidase